MAAPPLRVLLSGSSGLIGTALQRALVSRGSKVTCLVRGSFASKTAWPSFGEHTAEGVLHWDPDSGTLDTARLEHFDAVVHLAGESVGAGGGPLALLGRWTAESKRRVYDSRIPPTGVLARALASTTQRPKVFVCASGVGYYGARNNGGVFDESSPPGDDFLALLARDWEAACAPAAAAGIRTVNTRFGAVLSRNGGILAKLILPFSFGLGGNLGLAGSQAMPWVELNDAVRAIIHAVDTPALSGPVNVVSPAQTTNAEFTAALAAALCRPAFLHLPEAAVRFVFGEMGDVLLLASQRVRPSKLLESGFVFNCQSIEDGIAAALKE